MTPIRVAFILGAAALGIAAGFICRGLLLEGFHRRTPEEHAEPTPTTWWVPAAAASASALLAWRYGPYDWPWLLAFLPFAILGAHLAAIDIDVHRLPNRELTVLTALTIPATVAAAILTNNAWAPLIGLACAAATLGIFLILDRIQPGGLGGGDIKLATLIAFTTGSRDLALPWTALIAASLIAALYALIRHRQRSVFGPALYTGTILAIAAAG